jgi:hypothetical protein
MYICNKWPRQTFWPIFSGSIIEAIGIGLLAWACSTRGHANVNGMMGLAGVGTGLRFMPVTLHASGIWPSRLAPILSLMSFVMPFGGTISIGMMSAVFTNKFNIGIAHVFSGSEYVSNLHSATSLDAITHLPLEIQEQIRVAAAKAVMWAFISLVPFMVISAICSAALGNVWVVNQGKSSKTEEKDRSGEVVYGSYLKALVQVR